MVKKYPKEEISKEFSHITPSIEALKFILNYSKSLEVRKNGKAKVHYHLN